MSCVRFKLKSSLEYDKVTFDGLHISVGDLRKKIMAQKKLGITDNFTLQIMDAQSKKVYSNDSETVPRNTSVIIMRVPVPNTQKNPKIQSRDVSIPKDNGVIFDNLKKTGDLAGADASEEDKVLAMMSQAGEEFNPANYARFKPRGGNFAGSNLVKQPPPTNYVCHRCGQKGHWIKFCPTNGDPNFDNPRIKAPSGIPRSHVVPVTTDTVGAMKDRQGNLVKRKVDIIANVTSKAKLLEELDTSVPQELTCNICKELIKDAVIIPCCGESFCDECIREYLLENEFKCFACEETDVSPDTLVPNKRLRNDAKKFQTVMTQKKRLAVTRGLPGFVLTDSATPSSTSSSKVTMEEVLTSPTNLTATDSLSTDVKSPVTQSSSASLPLSPAPSKTEPAPPSPKQSKEKQNDGSVDHSVADNRDETPTPPPTPPLLPITASKSPVPLSSAPSSSVQITQPISLYSNSRPLMSNAKLSGLMNTPLIPNALGVPGMGPLIQSTIFNPNPLLQGTVPISFTVPTPVIPTVPQPSANPLLLQSTTGLNPSGGSLDPAQMARLAELLVAAESHKKSPSPIPLSFEEFRRQQKVLRGLDQPPARRKSRTDSHSDSYSSRSYSSRSRSATPISRRRRTRSRSFSADIYDSRQSRSPSSGKSKKRRHNSIEDKSRRRHKHKSSERNSSKKSHKRKHHGRTDETPPPHEDEEELQETKSKRYKRKKHKHSKKHSSEDKTETNSSNDALLATDYVNDDGITSKGSDNDKNPSTNPASVSRNPPETSLDPTVGDMNHIARSPTNSQSMEGIEVSVQNNKISNNSDTDVVSGGSTPVLPDTASGGSTPILSSQATLDSVLLSSEPSTKHSRKSKHKHSKKDNGVAVEEKERRHHHKMKKHRKHKENSRSSHEKRKKSHKRIEK